MQLRPYQVDALTAVKAGFNPPNNHRRQLVVMPTASGKTVLFSKLAEYVAPKRTLILAHREELLDQAKEKLRASTGIEADIEAADRHADTDATVVIGSVASMMQDKRLERWDPDHFKLVVCDEAHHSISPSWQKVLNYFIKSYQLGVTATPDRGDKKALSAWYQNIPYECTLIDLIGQGYLCRIRAKTIPLQIDLGAVRVMAGDYSADDVGEALEPHLVEIAREVAGNYHDRKSLAFLPLIKTSKAFVEACKAHGLRAEHVDGTDTTETRQGVLARLASGETQLVSNAMLFTEGVDCPPVDCVIPLRPTKIRSLFAQQIGRGTRIHPGKEHLLILDFLWLTKAHNVIRAGDLVALDEQEAAQLNRRLRNGEDIVDEMEIVRNDHLLAVLHRNREKKGEEYDLVEFATAIGNIEVADFEPTMHWHSDPMSQPQASLIAKWGIDPRGVKNKGHASQIIDCMMKRRDNGLATYKQVRLLQRQGIVGCHLLSFDQASNMIEAYMDRWSRKAGR